jgi:hypothetical protein
MTTRQRVAIRRLGSPQATSLVSFVFIESNFAGQTMASASNDNAFGHACSIGAHGHRSGQARDDEARLGKAVDQLADWRTVLVADRLVEVDPVKEVGMPQVGPR